MAYGAGTPADDWGQDYHQTTDSKSPNSSLTNPLTSHGANCRRINGGSDNKIVAYRLLDSSFTNDGSKSIRGFFRIEDSGRNPVDSEYFNRPRLIANAELATGIINLNTGYHAVIHVNGSHEAVVSVGTRVHTSSGDGLSSYSAVISGAICTDSELKDLWMGMRLDVIKEDQDAHIKVYIAKGPAVCNNLDANGEPVWTKYLDVKHIIGSNIPVVNLGTVTHNFGTTTPWTDGWMAFGSDNHYACPNCRTYIDTISCKKIDA
jgi:hypothetical protein